MIRIGITGAQGFIGAHLVNFLKIHQEQFTHVPFERKWFEDDAQMDNWVGQCDAIVHLAGINRHDDEEVIRSLLGAEHRTRDTKAVEVAG